MYPSVSAPTALGKLIVSWQGENVARVRLNAPSTLVESETTPPRAIKKVLAQLQRFVAGEAENLDDIPLALADVPSFHQQAYRAARALQRGETATYGELAARAGSPKGSRAAGQAMATNRFTLIVPCHRVLPGDGKLGNFSAFGGDQTKRVLLANEGVALDHAWTHSEALAHLRSRDPAFAKWIDRVGECRLRTRTLPSVFDGLAESIVYQQLSGRAAETIWLRVLGLFGPRGFTAEAVHGETVERLRTAGLSQAKALALKDLAARATAGRLAERKQLQRWSDSVVIERLSEVRGIGPWTVQMLLMFRLGRPDVFPLADLGVQKGLARVLGLTRLPNEREMLKAQARFSPYGSVAAWYCWRFTELP